MKNIIKNLVTFQFGHGTKAWYLKHVSDFYVKKANQKHYRSRASFKLLQIINKHPRLVLSPKQVFSSLNKQEVQQPAQFILDLGSSPGSWSQVLNQILPNSKIVSVDLLEMKPIKGTDFYRCDARNKQLHKVFQQKYEKFELIVSDMAPNFDGDQSSTHVEIIQLNSLCVQLCFELGADSCSLVMKSVQGNYEKAFFNILNSVFKKISRQKPESSRSESIQFFYVCENLVKTSPNQKQSLVQLFKNIRNNAAVQLSKHKDKKISALSIKKLMK